MRSHRGAGHAGIRRGLVVIVAVAVMVPLLAGSASAALPRGAAIDASQCTYGPGELIAGKQTGQYLGDTQAFYAITLLPANMPGGHFQFRAQFPRARWLSYQSYDQSLATQGVIDDLSIKANRGSVNPFLPHRHYRRGHVGYTVNVLDVPPAQRQKDPPGNVLYAGYRMNPHYGGLIHTPSTLVLYSHYVALDKAQRGGVPLPKLYWIVDDSQTNVFQSEADVCAAMQVAGEPFSSFFQINEIGDRHVWTPILEPFEKHIDIPGVLDPVPHDPPYVNVVRPSPNGYQEPLFNEQTPYIYTQPSSLFGRFVVIRFKAPTFPHVEEGIPSTGREQSQYWSWCAGQLVSLINIATGCVSDFQFHIHHDYATLVVSPANQRPLINGKPYPDWLEWSGGSTAIFMGEISPNPKTFPQSPYFMPEAISPDNAFDFVFGVTSEPQIKAWMGAYYPQISYCTEKLFERNACQTSTGLQLSNPLLQIP